VDFSQTESTSESHRPNQTPDSSAVRSQQVVESVNGGGAGALPTGIPGATTNQPPVAAAAPVNGAAQALAAAGASSAAGGSGSGASKRESIINYEVDKTIRVVRGGTGLVKRISAAVVLNHQTVTDARGRTTTTPLSPQQTEQLTALVRETVGFNKDRGDSVNIMNTPFAIETQTITEVPLWRQPEIQDLARSLAWPLGTLLLAALVLMGLVRPALRAMGETMVVKPVPGERLDAVVADDTDRPPLLTSNAPKPVEPPTQAQLRLEEARKLTRDNPAAVANIVKGWMGNEAPA
jgi:flagellar M-ring protein FliF